MTIIKSCTIFLIRYWKTIIIASVIFYGSLTSSNNLNKVHFLQIHYMDKIIHFLLYFMLSVSFQSSLIRNFHFKKYELVTITLIIVISYGLILEVFQYYYTNTRSAEFLDALANTIGCITGILLMPVIKKLNLVRFL